MAPIRIHRPLLALAALLPGAALADTGGSGEAAARLGQSAPAMGAGTALELMLGLGLVLGAIAVTAWVARRMLHLRPGMDGRMRVLGGLNVGGRERVVLVQVGEQQLVLGVAPGRVQTLHVLEEPVSVVPAAQGGQPAVAMPPFASVLRRFTAARGQGS